MENKYQIIINWDENKQIFIADTPDVPDCTTEGKTCIEALKDLEQLLNKKRIEETKIKRSFMLTESQIHKLHQMKSIFKHKKTLSEIVGEGIEFYYDELNK